MQLRLNSILLKYKQDSSRYLYQALSNLAFLLSYCDKSLPAAILWSWVSSRPIGQCRGLNTLLSYSNQNIPPQNRIITKGYPFSNVNWIVFVQWCFCFIKINNNFKVSFFKPQGPTFLTIPLSGQSYLVRLSH